jgi:hypothetical protein
MHSLFMSEKNQEVKMTKHQTEAVAEKLAEFFFDFFQNRQINQVRNNQVAIQGTGFSREDFPASGMAT